MKFFTRDKKRQGLQKQQWYLSRLQQPRDAEAYWDQTISPDLSKDQKILLAEELFCYIWKHHGSDEAIDQVASAAQQLQLAQARFDKGCTLCSHQNFESALVEIEKSRRIQESYGVWCQEETEIQLHYATGAVLMGLREYDKALSEFRQAWRIGGLKLGPSHILTRSSQQMIEDILCKDRCGLLEIHHNMAILRQAITHEKEGDFFRVAGDFDLAINEYRQSILEYQRHQDEPHVATTAVEQAEIRSKIARILEEQAKRRLAEMEWASSLSLYQSALGSCHPKTIESMTGLIRNHSSVWNCGQIAE